MNITVTLRILVIACHCHTPYSCQWTSLSQPAFLSVYFTVKICILVIECHFHTLYSSQWISLSYSVCLSVNITVTPCIHVSQPHCNILYSYRWISLWHPVFLSGDTNFSQKHTASLFRYHPITWRQHVTFKRRHELQNCTVSQPIRSQSHHRTLSIFQ